MALTPITPGAAGVEAGAPAGAHRTVRFAPLSPAHWLAWGVAVLVALGAPLVFTSGFSLTLLSQMGIVIVFCLSYNMLFGQGGMLSFGHAVYSGLGAFFAIHALNMIGAGSLPLPVSLLPLVGGLFGALFGVLFGYVTTKKSGTPFAMITLGIGELVFASAFMFPGFFGGEGGITSNRVVGEPRLGITFGPQIQVYYLIAAWCLLATAAMYAFAQTPLGRISNAVRDNPERVEFIGYDTQRVRYLVLIASAFFAGISGGLAAINFEIVSAENVGAARSGGVLLATFIGGATFFFGPILGAIVFTFSVVALSDFTKAWQLYLGVFFVLMVMYAPGGLAGMIMTNVRVARFGLLGRLAAPYAALFAAGLALAAAVVVAVEMGYFRTLESFGGDTVMDLFGLRVDTGSITTWAAAVGALVVTGAVFEWVRRGFERRWDAVQGEIEQRVSAAARRA